MRHDQIRALITASVRRAVEITPRPDARPGTITQPPATDGTIEVRIDGDVAPVTCERVGGDFLTIGDRVLVVFFPPHGAFVFGEIGSGINTGQTTAYKAVTAAYTVGPNDGTIDCYGANYTVTLPTAVGNVGRIYTVKRSAGPVKTVGTTGGETIDGAATVNLGLGDSITVQSTGANWIII